MNEPTVNLSPTFAVIHEDDLGMCHGSNAAFVELSRLGACTSGSVMVPCPWFSEIIDLMAGHSYDVGVHLTLNSEKKYYRWRPLEARSKSGGLVDSTGFFHPNVPATQALADRGAVEDELRAQIESALAAGLCPSHLDAHMGCACAPEFIDIYIIPAPGHGLGFNDLKTIEIGQFVTAIAEQRRCPPDLADAYAISKICEAVLQSHTEQRWVVLKRTAENHFALAP